MLKYFNIYRHKTTGELCVGGLYDSNQEAADGTMCAETHEHIGTLKAETYRKTPLFIGPVK